MFRVRRFIIIHAIIVICYELLWFTSPNVTEIRRGTLVRRSIDDEHTHALLSSPIAHARVYMPTGI